jgi:HAD superfamily hydrolase (TIGR01549 family)
MLTTTSPTPGVLLDLDGTLIDSVYLHVVTWHATLQAAGHLVPMTRIHAGIGMGSDRLLPWLLGDHVAEADALADEHTRRFLDRADRLVPTTGAAALVRDLETREVPFVIATSAGTEEREALLAALGRDDLPVTGADDVGSSKPAPDLLTVACAQLEVEPDHVVMVGDSPWDAVAATHAGMEAVAVRCGGFGDLALREGGAKRIVDAPLELIGTL